MTGKLVKGSSFRGALRYNLEKVTKNVAEVLDSTFVRMSEHSIMQEVQMIRSLRPRLEKYFYHTSINFPPEENISSELMKTIGKEYLSLAGFTDHQYIMFRHRDADHPHFHILVNRIDYDGNVKTDSNDFQQTEKILRQLEIKYGLRQVTPSHLAKERPATKDELEMIVRTHEPSTKLKLQILVSKALQSKPSISMFISNLESQGVHILFNQATTGYVSGVSFEMNGIVIKGGKLGNDFKWTELKSKLNYEQERDRQRIHETNLRSLRAGKHKLNDRANRLHPPGSKPTIRTATAKLKNERKNDRASPQGTVPKSSSVAPHDHQGHHHTGKHHHHDKNDASSLNMGSILDTNTLRDLIIAPHEPDKLDNPVRSKRKRRKKRKIR